MQVPEYKNASAKHAAMNLQKKHSAEQFDFQRATSQEI